jgi:hypothetical protein
MTVTDLLGMTTLAIELIAVIAVPGEPRWLARPWLFKGPPRRATIAAFPAVLVLAAIVRAIFKLTPARY